MDAFISALTITINDSYILPTITISQLPYPFNFSLTTVDYSVPTPHDITFTDLYINLSISSIESTGKSTKPTSSLKSTKGTSAKSTTKSEKPTASTKKSTTIKSTLKSTTGKSTEPTSSLKSTKETSAKSTTISIEPTASTIKSTTIKSTLKSTTVKSTEPTSSLKSTKGTSAKSTTKSIEPTASTIKSTTIKSTLKSTTGTPAMSTTKLTLNPTTTKSTIKTTLKSTPATKKTATLKSTLKSIPQTSQMIPKPTPTTIVQKPTQSKKGKKITLPYYPEHTNLPTPPKPAVPPTANRKKFMDVANNLVGKSKRNRVARNCFERTLNGVLTVFVAFREAFGNCYFREDINPILVIIKICSRIIAKALYACRTLFGPMIKLQCAGLLFIAVFDLAKEIIAVVPTLSSRDIKLKTNCLKQQMINVGCAVLILIGDVVYCSFKTLKNPF